MFAPDSSFLLSVLLLLLLPPIRRASLRANDANLVMDAHVQAQEKDDLRRSRTPIHVHFLGVALAPEKNADWPVSCRRA